MRGNKPMIYGTIYGCKQILYGGYVVCSRYKAVVSPGGVRQTGVRGRPTARKSVRTPPSVQYRVSCAGERTPPVSVPFRCRRHRRRRRLHSKTIVQVSKAISPSHTVIAARRKRCRRIITEIVFLAGEKIRF